jgi:hypothetical protein
MAWLTQVARRSTSSWSASQSGYCRMTRRTSTPATSRSCNRADAEGLAGCCSSSLLVLTNRRGSANNRPRITAPASRHARHSSPTSRVDNASEAMAAASCSQSARLARAIGTRCLIAAWAPIRPRYTSSCTVSGSSLTRASRRDTQLELRSNRRASSSWPRPKLDCSSRSNHPCSNADSASLVRNDRLSISASASLIDHTVAVTRSWPSLCSARTRLCPSTTT